MNSLLWFHHGGQGAGPGAWTERAKAHGTGWKGAPALPSWPQTRDLCGDRRRTISVDQPWPHPDWHPTKTPGSFNDKPQVEIDAVWKAVIRGTWGGARQMFSGPWGIGHGNR